MSTITSCYVCLPYLAKDEKLISGLESIFSNVVIHGGEERPDRAELENISNNYNCIIVGTKEKLSKEIARESDKLETIGTLSTGLDHIDTEAFEKKDIDIFSVDQSNSISVAEHTLGLILSLQKRLLESHKSVRKGNGRDGLSARPVEMKGKTVGIIGAGSIAKELVELLESFNVEIKIWTFNPEKHTDIEGSNVSLEENLSELIQQSDIVTVHIPLSEKTDELINSDLLDQIETDRHRILINTSRAGIIEENILHDIGPDSVFNAAGLDVYSSDLPEKVNNRVIFTPHIAGLTQESTRRMRDELVSKIASKHG